MTGPEATRSCCLSGWCPLTGASFFNDSPVVGGSRYLAPGDTDPSTGPNKAVEALRKATKGRRRATGPELQLVSLDANREAGEELRDEVFDAEAEYIAINQQLILRRLAQQVLNQRDRDIYYRVHYLRTPLVELAPRYDLSPQRVGQIYAKSARKLHAAGQTDPDFRRLSDPAKGGTDDE